MNQPIQLIFHGEILPGHDPFAVKARLAAVLKISPEQVDRVFSGERVVLHKGLPASEVERYVSHLEQMGVRVHAEPLIVAVADAPMPSTVPPTSTPAAPVKPSPAEPLVEEMSCPKCGERQPRRTLCRSCAVDMKRFAEARADAEREEREARVAAKRGEAPAAAAAASAGAAVGEGGAGMFGFGFEGRLGRIEYLFGGLLCLALLLFAAAGLARGMSLVVFLIGSLLSCYFSLRLTALRCHDQGWSGWMGLILLIPYIGWAFGVLLMALPGERNDNRFGSPARSAPLPAVFATVAVFALSVALVVRSPDAADPIRRLMAGGAIADAAERPRAATGGVTVSEVEIFTTTTCGECARAKAYMKRRGIAFVERDVEFDIDTRREFYERGGKGVPYLFVRGQSMLGFDEGVFERLWAG